MTTRSGNKKNHRVRDTPLTPRMGEDEKALLETTRKIVKDVTDLKQSLEFTQE